MGLMAQCEQRTIYFDVETEAEETGYVDLASAMTAANRKQYHQVARDGTAKCYTCLVTCIKGDVTLSHMQNSFITCNAVKQTTQGWHAQLRHAGVKLRDLPPYGKRPRFALEAGSYVRNNAGLVGETIFEIAEKHLKPKLLPGGVSYFAPYTATDGDAITYRALEPPVVGSHAANMITQVTVTDGAGTEANEPLVLVGATTIANEFNVIQEYLAARRGSPDVSIDTPGPAATSPMLNLFSVSEEMSDDIVEGIEDYMDWKPYTPDKSPNHFDELTEGIQVTTVTTTTTQSPPVSGVVDIPLGLFKIVADTDSRFRIDVLAIYEM